VGLVEHPTNPISDKVIGAAIEVHRHKLLPIHSAQLMTYIRLQRVSCGLLLNFNLHILPHGIRSILR
jgi:PD-(D/E)XK nuclease superfamily protein